MGAEDLGASEAGGAEGSVSAAKEKIGVGKWCRFQLDLDFRGYGFSSLGSSVSISAS